MRKPKVKGRHRPLARLALVALGLVASGAAAAAPAADSAQTRPSTGQPSSTGKKAPPKSEKLVDINSASKAQLKTLPGVGEAEASRIIAARPYVSKADLVTKAGLPEGLYLAVRYRIVAAPPRKPAPKK